jgi:phosphatidylserine/phosphatidylglycerophosphate/cardiolipin synthase-like enzyme
LSACAAPGYDDLFTEASVTATDGPGASAAAITLIERATSSIKVALPAVEDLALAQALADARALGVSVEVITDIERQNDPGLAILDDAGVEVTLGGRGLGYFEFTLGEPVEFVSNDTVISSSFVVVDEIQYVSAWELGHAHADPRWLVEGRGQDPADDLLKEHNQLFGYRGVPTDATAVTAFDNTAKSVADPRWSYLLGTGSQLELWFGPQERVTKRVIDAIYSARSSIRVLTDELANDGLAKALQDKAELGFDVQLIVGPQFGTTNGPLARVVVNETPDVTKRRMGAGRVPTVVLIDLEPARDGRPYTARGFMLTHDLYSAKRLYRGTAVRNDQLIDGVLWTVNDVHHQGDPATWAPEIQALHQIWDDHLQRSGGF